MLNLNNVSYIEDDEGKKAVLISLEHYEQMLDRLEELEDVKDYIERKNDATIPFSIAEALLEDNKGNKIKILRKYRQLTVEKLANQIGITKSYLSQIENNKRQGNINIYKKLSQILEIDIDLII